MIVEKTDTERNIEGGSLATEKPLIRAAKEKGGQLLSVAPPNPEVQDKAVRLNTSCVSSPSPMPALRLGVWERCCVGRGCMHRTSTHGVTKESGEYCQPCHPRSGAERNQSAIRLLQRMKSSAGRTHG